MPPVRGRSSVPASGELRGEDVENYAQLRGAPPPAGPPRPLPVREQDVEAGPLGDRERTVLVFERQWWRHAGAKEEAIRREFGIGPTAYYRVPCQVARDDSGRWWITRCM